MPYDPSNQYSPPPNTEGVPDQVIASAKYNSRTGDLADAFNDLRYQNLNVSAYVKQILGIDDDADLILLLGLGALAFLDSVGTAQLADGAVTNVKLMNMAANTIKGASVSGAPQDLSREQAAGVLELGTKYSPIGMIAPFAGVGAPAGWLLCYGQNVPRATYPKLFSVIDTVHGAGDGSTTFGIPDLRGRVIAGKDNMGGAVAGRLAFGGFSGTVLGFAGGSDQHVITPAQLAAHNHGVNEGNHQHTFARSVQGISASSLTGGGTIPHYYSTGADTIGGTNPQPTGVTTQSTGSNGAHNNIQPTSVMNAIIFAGE